MIALVAAYALVQSDFVAMPGEMKGSYVCLNVHTSDGKEHPFLVDSGSNESYVIKDAVAEGDRSKFESELRLDVGKAQVFAKADVVDVSKLPASIGGLHPEGILGLNLLKQIQVEIDYDAQAVRARFGGALGSVGPAYTPYLVDKDLNGLFVLHAKLKEKDLRLCVDTGATSFFVDAKRVELKGFPKLGETKVNSFGGQSAQDRYLIDNISIDGRTMPWMVASSFDLKDTNDGTIGASLLGGSKVVLDFPGACVYVEKSDPISQAASRILGLPVVVEGDGMRFRERVPPYFKPYSSAKILAVRKYKAAELITALRGQGSAASETLIAAFGAMRGPGLLTMVRNGTTELLPMQVSD